MAEIDGDAILARAKSLCAQDGFAWELDFTLPYPPAGHLRGSHYPSEQRRQQYLVGRVVHSAGYNLFSFTRASAVVNCQLALACVVLRSASHASTSSFKTC